MFDEGRIDLRPRGPLPKVSASNDFSMNPFDPQCALLGKDVPQNFGIEGRVPNIHVPQS